MTKLLEQALEAVRKLPPDSQDAIAGAMLSLAEIGAPDDTGPEHLSAVAEVSPKTASGESAYVEEVTAAFRRFEQSILDLPAEHFPIRFESYKDNIAMTVRFLRNVLASSLAMITIMALTGCSDDKSQSFDPLVSAKINTVGRSAEFATMVRSFVAEQRLIIDFANFPLDEDNEKRQVLNFEIDLDNTHKTFIIIDNFRSQDKFDVICYSHESENRWKPFWDTFITTAREKLGPERVEVNPKR